MDGKMKSLIIYSKCYKEIEEGFKKNLHFDVDSLQLTTKTELTNYLQKYVKNKSLESCRGFFLFVFAECKRNLNAERSEFYIQLESEVIYSSEISNYISNRNCSLLFEKPKICFYLYPEVNNTCGEPNHINEILGNLDDQEQNETQISSPPSKDVYEPNHETLNASKGVYHEFDVAIYLLLAAHFETNNNCHIKLSIQTDDSNIFDDITIEIGALIIQLQVKSCMIEKNEEVSTLSQLFKKLIKDKTKFLKHKTHGESNKYFVFFTNFRSQEICSLKRNVLIHPLENIFLNKAIMVENNITIKEELRKYLEQDVSKIKKFNDLLKNLIIAQNQYSPKNITAEIQNILTQKCSHLYAESAYDALYMKMHRHFFKNDNPIFKCFTRLDLKECLENCREIKNHPSGQHIKEDVTSSAKLLVQKHHCPLIDLAVIGETGSGRLDYLCKCVTLNSSEYQHIIWLRSDNTEQLEYSIWELGKSFSLVEDYHHEIKLLDVVNVMNNIKKFINTGKSLIVFQNVKSFEDIKPFVFDVEYENIFYSVTTSNINFPCKNKIDLYDIKINLPEFQSKCLKSSQMLKYLQGCILAQCLVVGYANVFNVDFTEIEHKLFKNKEIKLLDSNERKVYNVLSSLHFCDQSKLQADLIHALQVMAHLREYDIPFTLSKLFFKDLSDYEVKDKLQTLEELGLLKREFAYIYSFQPFVQRFVLQNFFKESQKNVVKVFNIFSQHEILFQELSNSMHALSIWNHIVKNYDFKLIDHNEFCQFSKNIMHSLRKNYPGNCKYLLDSNINVGWNCDTIVKIDWHLECFKYYLDCRDEENAKKYYELLKDTKLKDERLLRKNIYSCYYYIYFTKSMSSQDCVAICNCSIELLKSLSLDEDILKRWRVKFLRIMFRVLLCVQNQIEAKKVIERLDEIKEHSIRETELMQAEEEVDLNKNDIEKHKCALVNIAESFGYGSRKFLKLLRIFLRLLNRNTTTITFFKTLEQDILYKLRHKHGIFHSAYQFALESIVDYYYLGSMKKMATNIAIEEVDRIKNHLQRNGVTDIEKHPMVLTTNDLLQNRYSNKFQGPETGSDHLTFQFEENTGKYKCVMNINVQSGEVSTEKSYDCYRRMPFVDKLAPQTDFVITNMASLQLPKPKGNVGEFLGYDYEKANIMLMYQHLEEKNEEFFLANNVEHLGILDDIVCKIIHTDGSIQLLFVQLKSSINNEQIICKSENTKKEDIKDMRILENIVNESFESFKKVFSISKNTSNEKISESQKDMFNKFFNKPLDECSIEFVFFSDRQISQLVKDNLKETQNASETLKSILRTDNCFELPDKQESNGSKINFHKIYKSEDAEFQKFIQNFKFCVNQSSTDDIEQVIKSKLLDFEKENVFKKVKVKIDDWYRKYDNVDTLTLNDHLFIKFASSLYMKKNEVKWKVCRNITYNTQYLNRLSKERKLVFSYSSEDDKVVFTTLIKQLMGKTQNPLITETANLTLLQRFLGPNSMFTRLFVLLESEPQMKETFMKTIQEFATRKDNRVIFVCHTKCLQLLEQFSNHSLSISEFKFEYLTEESKKIISERNIDFQGVRTSFENLFSRTRLENNPQIVSKLAQNEQTFSIGSKLEDPTKEKPYYVPRYFITNDVKYSLKCMQRHGQEDFYVFLLKKSFTYNESLLKSEQCVMSADEKIYDIKCKEMPKRNIHLFECNKSSIKYVKSSNCKLNYENILREIGDVMIPEIEFVNDFISGESENKQIIISDTPGNGKSFTLKNLAYELKQKNSDLYVVFLDSNTIKKLLGSIKEKKLDTDFAIDLISHNVLKHCNIEKEVFKYFCDMNKKVILLIDAFDEIVLTYEKTVAALLACLNSTKIQNIIVTTRPYCLEAIAKVLPRSVVVEMVKFDQHTQRKFLVDKWTHSITEKSEKTQEVIEKSARILTEFIHESDYVSFQKITGIPLLLNIFADVILEEFIKTGKELKLDYNFNFLQLYDKYFEIKLEIFLKEKLLCDKDQLLETRQVMRTDAIKNHKNLAILEIFSSKSAGEFFNVNENLHNELRNGSSKIEKLGLVDKPDEKFKFTHRTFAEYFCAVRIISQIHSACDSKLISFFLGEILIKDEYIVIRKFLNENILNLSVEIFPNEKYKVFHIESNCKKNILYLLSDERLDNIYKWLKQCIHHNGNTEIFYSTILNKKLSLVFQMGSINDKHYEIDLYKHSNSTENQQSLFFEALIKGYVCIVETMIENAPECVNSSRFIDRYTEDMSALEYLCSNALCDRVEEMIKLLFEKGAVVNNESKDYTSMPLIASVTTDKSINLIELLVENGADVNLTCRDGRTPLMYAADHNRLDIVELLITKYKVDVNFLCDEQCSALFYAVRDKNIEIVQFMLEHGAIVHSNTLIMAVKKCNFEITELLLEKKAGADPGEG